MEFKVETLIENLHHKTKTEGFSLGRRSYSSDIKDYEEPPGVSLLNDLILSQCKEPFSAVFHRLMPLVAYEQVISLLTPAFAQEYGFLLISEKKTSYLFCQNLIG